MVSLVGIEACLTNQPIKSKLALPITFTLAAVYHSCTYYVQEKVGVVYMHMGVRELRCLKQELIWAIDKQYWFISKMHT